MITYIIMTFAVVGFISTVLAGAFIVGLIVHLHRERRVMSRFKERMLWVM
jgi:hypothetical protein